MKFSNKFIEYKGTLAYKEIKRRYGFKLESFDNFKLTSEISPPFVTYEVSDLYEFYYYGNLNNLSGIFIYNAHLIRFAKKHKRSILRCYKNEREHSQGCEQNVDTWLKEKGYDITDLICGHQDEKDEVLRLLACVFLQEIAYILFDSWECENDKKMQEIQKELERQGA